MKNDVLLKLVVIYQNIATLAEFGANVAKIFDDFLFITNFPD